MTPNPTDCAPLTGCRFYHVTGTAPHVYCPLCISCTQSLPHHASSRAHAIVTHTFTQDRRCLHSEGASQALVSGCLQEGPAQGVNVMDVGGNRRWVGGVVDVGRDGRIDTGKGVCTLCPSAAAPSSQPVLDWDPPCNDAPLPSPPPPPQGVRAHSAVRHP